MRIKQAVILAGGAGSRLRPFTKSNPKPMIPVNGKPFLEYLIALLKDNGIEEIIILIGYMGEKIKDYLGNGSRYKIKIKYSYTPFLFKDNEETLSGQRLKNAKEMLNSFFLLLYCDNYWPLDLEKLKNFYEEHPSDVLVTVFSNKDKFTKNNILVKSGYAVKYDSTRKGQDLNGVDIGFFIVKKKVLNLLSSINSKFESDVLPQLIQKRKLSAFLTDQKYYSISDKKRVKVTEKFLTLKKIILLDRDGVINRKASKADYIKNWSEFEFLPGVIDAIKILNSKGYKIYVVSNQAGIARGALDEKDLKNIHSNMHQELKKNGARVDGIYYCPHGWDENCICRKPKPGLLLQASKDRLFDLTKAIFIGDDKRDLEAGKAAGCKTILVDEKNNLLNIVKYLK